ncbi:17872_t:CDS:2, partial [Rhizophagus irregularis]
VFASQALSNSNSLWILDQNNNRNPIIYGKISYDIENVVGHKGRVDEHDKADTKR